MCRNNAGKLRSEPGKRTALSGRRGASSHVHSLLVSDGLGDEPRKIAAYDWETEDGEASGTTYLVEEDGEFIQRDLDSGDSRVDAPNPAAAVLRFFSWHAPEWAYAFSVDLTREELAQARELARREDRDEPWGEFLR